MPNQYYVCLPNSAPIAFDVANERPTVQAEVPYFIRAFQLLERNYGLDKYTIYFAPTSLVRLPRLGHDVIAVIYGDEFCRIPPYVNSVAAVFKTIGLFPNFVPRRRPLRLVQIEAVEFLRNLALWLPTGWRWALSSRVRTRCHLVPMGCGMRTDVQPLPFDQRPYLASFFGSIAHPESRQWLRSLMGTPKSYCRSAILAVLRDLQERYGAEAVPLRLSGSFQESIQDASRSSYFEVLGRTKLCLAPRGTTHETWRMSDGLRFGCVVIADRLPAHSFYHDCPIIQIDDWNDLPALIERLLSDASGLRALAERGQRYWNEVLSDVRLAARFAEGLALPERAEQRAA